MLNKKNYKELLLENRGNNFIFLEDYKTSKEPILCKCNICNTEWKVAPYELIIRKSNCPNCSKKSSNDKKRKGLDYYKNKLKEYYGYEPYTFLDNNYINNQTKLKIKCNKCNYEFKSDISHLMQNIKLKREPLCKNCFNINRSLKYNNESYQNKLDKTFKEKSYTILEDYKGFDVPILHKCNICNYEWKISPNNILNNNTRSCPKCNNMIRKNNSYEEKLIEINSKLIPLESYKGRNIKILHKCKICNYEWKAIPNNTLKGSGCPKCSKKIIQSSYEKLLINFLKNECNIENIKINDRKVLEGKELDIYLPDYNFAFEINGTYYHSEKYKDKNYHLNKTELCNKKGITLIHIFDDEIRDKQEILFSKIKHLLKKNYNLEKIYARKCIVKEISNNDKNDFLNKNHIQGYDTSSIRLGLYYKDILVSVMTFCKPRSCLGSKNSTYDYELSRFANNNNYIVIGSFGKLFKYFKDNYEWKNIITYADRRWSIGNIYFKNNFHVSHYSRPNYWYVNKNTKKRYHRYNFRKDRLEKLFPELYDKNKTEKEIMELTNYVRIYDCGNIVFYYEKKTT